MAEKGIKRGYGKLESMKGIQRARGMWGGVTEKIMGIPKKIERYPKKKEGA